MRKFCRFLASKLRARKIRRRNRSLLGDIGLTLVLAFFGLFSLFPLIFTVVNAFKPLSEIFIIPPKMSVENPTLNNFFDLATIVESFQVPLSRYIFNTGMITCLGTLGTVLLGSMAAFPLAKYTFPGSKLMSNIIVYALMFNTSVTAIPNYLIMSKLALVDTYWAVILPAVGSTLGLYLMKNFMVQIPDEMLEAAKIDGAGEFKTYWSVVMPLCKPAWITLIILSFQQMWGTTGGVFIYTEELKPVTYVLQQMVSGGISRTGVSSAISLIMLMVPVTVFIFSQSKVIETMATSGVKG
ncbi:MAG TPA: carbohydrate ABC transporter permease [Lachnospiraceae bacterium]|jgi:ABC-type glycerol-3-phosphate transport system permease component|nr:carbohydrate ABC transporter permease [Lachnospiraceae bacterium]HBY72913.1 carbohydrate ABC transporter permease [Lachnospiraceae bacterium]HCA70917.1 carbohydrate ABC transporter permease [Lachnospiraceae bacterium]HCM13438.1 carbohydrate ABC transporter permease [Lachnospiraceae bacterium]HCR40317.1 carbohydrate ABC transporter permease [Lachnospiraceae bacterium]